MQTKELTVSQMVRENYRTADVFKKYGINYCCGGAMDLDTACLMRGIDRSVIEAELKAARSVVLLPQGLPFQTWKPAFLVDYLLHIHHAYLTQTLPQLGVQLAGFTDGHKRKLPQFVEILEKFERLSTVLSEQMRYEEDVVFPYIRQLEHTTARREPYGSLFVRTLKKPLTTTENSGGQLALLDELKKAADNYQFPSNACTNHRVLFHRLKELDEGCRFHFQLEQQFLFPKALEMETCLLNL